MNEFKTPVSPLGSAIRHELEALKSEWWWFLLLGLGLVVLGVVALSSALITTAVSLGMTMFFGVLLLMGGVGQLISAFWAGRWSGFLLSLIVGLLYVVTGFVIIDKPGEGALALTLVLALMLLVSGMLRIVSALVLRFHHWGWPLLNGVISVLLGLLIYKQLPEAAFWVIGTFVGIEMIFNGWSWVMLALGLRSLDKQPAA
jgi:uncharacterized membrane protein HdeD (DUF308 family)